jgi:hypothetical protein
METLLNELREWPLIQETTNIFKLDDSQDIQ